MILQRWLIAATLLAAVPVWGQGANPDALFHAKQWSRALEVYAAIPDSDPRAPQTLFRAAECCAQLHRADDAFAYLNRLVDAADDFETVSTIANDDLLEDLKADPRWLQLTDHLQARWKQADAHLLLRNEILRMSTEDQCIRFAGQAVRASHGDQKAIVERMARTDHAHTERLKQLVRQYGWPDRKMVGHQASQAAWLLVQHADDDRPFQKRCLELMRPLVDKGLVRRTDVAYLTDRVLVGAGKPQLYGTQFYAVDGKLVPRPVDDPSHLDERRKAMGLSSMDAYTRQMQQLP